MPMQIGIFSGFRSSRMTCIAIGIFLASTMALVRGDNHALLEAAADPRHAWEVQQSLSNAAEAPECCE